MSLAQSLLPEFDHEMATTRTLLAVVPDAHAGWKPHAKSMSLGELAEHLANMPNWALSVLKQDELDLDAPGDSTESTFSSIAATLQRYDGLVSRSRSALAETPDAVFATPWTLRSGGHTIFSMPRRGVFRSFVMSHMIHHRGQLSVYLRLLGVPVPSVYGPTADSGAH